MAMEEERLKDKPAVFHPHFLRNAAIMSVMLIFLGVFGRKFLSVMLWVLVDITDHLEAWLAVYVISAALTVMAVGFDAAMALATLGIFAPFKGFLGLFWRLLYRMYRVGAITLQLLALVMGVVMAMRLARAPAAALIIALHLGLTLTGYLGVRSLEKMLREEQKQ